MPYMLTDEQQMMRDMVRKLAQNEIAPRAAEIDRTHRFPRENIEKMAELGLMGVPIPEEYGGAGCDFLSYIITIEEISRACASTGVILAVHTSVGTFPILYFGTEEQKQKYIPKLASGQYIGAFALTEPNAGSDPANLSTTARLEGDHYIVNGGKVFISNGGEASVYVTFVTTDKSKGHKGITCLLVDKDTPGFSIGKTEEKMGLHGDITTELIFDNARVPKENLLGKEGEGFKVAMALLDGGRIGIGAQGLGIAQAAFDVAKQYAKERVQFGKPIASFQAIQFMLADMATRIDCARLLVYRAARMRDMGLPYSKEASMAKMYATDTAMEVTTNAVQILGGYGYCKEYPVERYMRDAKITQIYEGTNQIQRLVIAKRLLNE
ncbi:acyl-CoA dehydrogenase [Desulfallas thermosapovorans]|uniref:Alkylation response protein AidB-like acyl-CoA dehydrogenase n=1 Tax=Desulfallas thermosapovorans DSM 6562 TaxID=1121431 RepID=A0A5S4ZYS1_9FIRM|nr:acyl-CoA dehydrogenase [Desulfallas thermosapovorans]TYO98058.1 alkylation response protein AidB-like acyl-CoA dehydrogenase [Desulfallas thermosapovorans DSM 6562]